MRHLAQIQRHPQSTQLQLVFVAQEQPDGSWLIHDQGDRPSMVYSQTEFAVGALVLIQLDKQRQLASIQDATDWLLNVVHHYFVPGKITPEFVQQEQKKNRNLAARNDGPKPRLYPSSTRTRGTPRAARSPGTEIV